MTTIYTKERVSAFKYVIYVVNDAVIDVVNKRLSKISYKKAYDKIDVMTPFTYRPNVYLQIEKARLISKRTWRTNHDQW